MTSRTPLLLLLGAAACGVPPDLAQTAQALTVSTEVALDAPVAGLASGDQVLPSVGFNGTEYLLAWIDDRTGETFPQVYGARVSAGGTLLDAETFPVSDLASDEDLLQVVSNGTDFLVAWAQQTPTQAVYAARVSAAGTVLDSPPLWLGASDGPSRLAADFDGTQYLVVWDSFNGMQARRVGPDGSLPDPEEVAVENGGSESSPTLAFANGVHLLAWLNGYGESSLGLERLSAALAPLDAVPVTAYPSACNSPAAASDGTRFLLTFVEGSTGQVTGFFIELDGGMSALSQIAPAQQAGDVQSAFDGTSYFVGWDNTSEQILGVAWGTSGGETAADGGNVLSEPGGGDRYLSGVACGAGECLTAWQDIGRWALGGGGEWKVYWERVDAGTSEDGDGLTGVKGVNGEAHPAVAFDGTHYFVVWQDDRSGGRELVGTLVDNMGNPLASSPVPLVGSTVDDLDPAVDFNGGAYLVAWEQNYSSSIVAMRVDTTGQPLDAAPFPLTDSALERFSPRVTHLGASWYVLWRTHEWTDSTETLRLTRVDMDGGVAVYNGTTLDTWTTDDSTADWTAALAVGGGELLAAWSHNDGGADTNQNGQIQVARVAADGTARDPAGIPVSIAGQQESPALASDGQRFWVLWVDGSNEGEIHARAVGYDGSLASADTVLTPDAGGAGAHHPSALFDGNAVFAMWEDATQGAVRIVGGELSLQGGEVTFASAGVLASQSHSDERPMAALGSAGQGLLVYQAFDATPSVRSLRVHAEAVQWTGSTGPGGGGGPGAGAGQMKWLAVGCAAGGGAAPLALAALLALRGRWRWGRSRK
jgi:hypothetical protein